MDYFETWLAKQEAMGREIPVTTAPYYAPKTSTVVTVIDGATVVTECE